MAFSRNWLAFEECQSRDATEGRRRFLDRFEWPSAWETAEVEHVLRSRWDAESGGEDQNPDSGADSTARPDGRSQNPGSGADPEYCHDQGKPRATMRQYVSLIGEDAAANLEGDARARLQKHPRQYQSDAAVH